MPTRLRQIIYTTILIWPSLNAWSTSVCSNVSHTLDSSISGDCIIPDSGGPYFTHPGGTSVSGSMTLMPPSNVNGPFSTLNISPTTPLSLPSAGTTLNLERSALLYGSGTISGSIVSDGTIDPTHSTPYVVAAGASPLNSTTVNSITEVPLGSVGSATAGNITINGSLRAMDQTVAANSNSALGFLITPSSNSQIVLGPSSSVDLTNIHLSVEAQGLGIGPGNNLKTTWTLIQGLDHTSSITGCLHANLRD